MTIDELKENFDILDNWEDKYRYIIDLGAKLEPLAEKYKTDEWKVQGCTSQVWLVPEVKDGKIIFHADSDASIVKGLLAIVLMIFSNSSAKDIKEVEAKDIFVKLGLEEHLSPSRRNGLFSMVDKIKYYADKL